MGNLRAKAGEAVTERGPQFAVAVRPRALFSSSPPRLEEATEIDVDVYDVIGDWWGEGVAAKDVLAKLRTAKAAKQINVRINSGGGDAWDGAAIYNLLAQHEAKVVVDVDGVAASAASVIAMAGDEIRMSETALMMIHNPWSFAVGEASDFRAKADELDKLRDSLANAYIRRTGLSRERIVELLDAETWMSAEEAVELGFATSVTPAKAAAAMLRSDLDLDRFELGDRIELARAIARVTARPERAKAGSPKGQMALEIKLSPESLAELDRNVSRLERLERNAPETDPPVPPGPPKEEPTMTTPNAAITAALGLPVGATEEDVLRCCARMRGLEVEVVALTGVQNSSEALGAVRALRETASRVTKLEADLATVRGERDAQNFEALVARGTAAPVKLTTAVAKMYRDEFTAAQAEGRGAEVVSRLKGYLDVAPTIPQLQGPRSQPIDPVGSGGGQPVVGPEGKRWEDLKPMQKHNLWIENPELYAAMRDDYQRRTG